MDNEWLFRFCSEMSNVFVVAAVKCVKQWQPHTDNSKSKCEFPRVVIFQLVYLSGKLGSTTFINFQFEKLAHQLTFIRIYLHYWWPICYPLYPTSSRRVEIWISDQWLCCELNLWTETKTRPNHPKKTKAKQKNLKCVAMHCAMLNFHCNLIHRVVWDRKRLDSIRSTAELTE